MTVHVEELTSETTFVDGELPLSPAQMEKIAAFVLQRLEERLREQRSARSATALRSSAEPPPPGGREA